MMKRIGLVFLVIFALVRSTYGISGAKIATTLEFPYAAQIVKGSEYVSGAIIHQYFVITRAHTIYNITDEEPIPKELLNVIVGHDKTSDKGTQYEVQRIIYHPAFTNTRGVESTDVALVKLILPIKFTNRVKVIPLAQSDVHNLRAAELECKSPGLWANNGLVISTLPKGKISTCLGDDGRAYVIGGKLVGIGITHTKSCNKKDSWMNPA